MLKVKDLISRQVRISLKDDYDPAYSSYTFARRGDHNAWHRTASVIDRLVVFQVIWKIHDDLKEFARSS